MHEKSKIPISFMLYAYSVKEPIGELNLKRAFVCTYDTQNRSLLHTSIVADQGPVQRYHTRTFIPHFSVILILCSYLY